MGVEAAMMTGYRKLLAVFNGRTASPAGAAATPPYSPYSNPAIDAIYNLLFFDDMNAVKPRAGVAVAPLQATLFSEPADTGGLEPIAVDAVMDGRMRYLAFRRLRDAGKAVPGKVLLGVIVENPMFAGLDVLAVFSEGGVRYINQTVKLAVFEGIPNIQPAIRTLFDASQQVINLIGTWEKPRRPPPPAGNIRLTFLTSDGLSFGEGPMVKMQQEKLAAAVIEAYAELLNAVVAMVSKPSR